MKKLIVMCNVDNNAKSDEKAPRHLMYAYGNFAYAFQAGQIQKFYSLAGTIRNRAGAS